ncbi:Serine/threonine protein kinase [Minicystis rosea]|nr:Serine/threonine protein kinase [Minicystis rosea]
MEQLGPYRITGEIDRGGMGVVYRGEHVDTGDVVAIKTVHELASDKLAALRHEIAALRRVRHPGIVPVIAEGTTEGVPWMAMPLLEGRTLRHHLDDLWQPSRFSDVSFAETHRVTEPLATFGQAFLAPRTGTHPVPLKPILTLVARLCAPIAFLHGEGLVHRDLKPENVFLLEDDRPVLVDLGIAAHFAGAGREELGLDDPAGTLHYIAPEQSRRELIDGRADLYALGCILYECITGRPPFLGETSEAVIQQHQYVPPIPPSRLVPGISEALERLVLILLEKRPRDRMGYAADVAAALVVLGAEPGPDSGPPPRTHLYRPDMTGRAEVVAAVMRAAQRVSSERRGGLVLIRGESGVGKTRLANEVAQRAAGDKLRVVTGTCVAAGAGEAGATAAVAGPLVPLRPLLLAAADLARTSPADAARLFGPRARILAPYEPSLLDLPGQADDPLPPLSPELSRERVITSLREIAWSLSDTTPLLVLIDDLQWADDLTLSVLDAVARGGVENHPVLFVVTYRSEESRPEIASLEGAAAATSISLTRLDSPSIAAMVAGMLAGSPPPRAVVDVLLRHSNGNPFFVAAYLRAAIDEGILRRDERGSFCFQARTGAALSELPLPHTLTELIERRLGRLGADELALVEWAAVLGQEIDDALLCEGPAPEGPSVVRALDELRARQILESASEGASRFVHDKIREIAYLRIPALQRAELHRLAGEALESRNPGAVSMAPSLGHHFARAGLHQRAGNYFVMAAEHAREVYANGDAIRFFHNAIVSLRHAGAGHGDIASLYERIGDVLSLVGVQDEARAAYESALAEGARTPGVTTSRLLRKAGKTREMHHQHDEALELYARAEAALVEVPTVLRDEAWSHEWLQIQHDRISVFYWIADIDRLRAHLDAIGPVVEARGTALDRGRYLHAASQLRLQSERFWASAETVACARACAAAFAAAGEPEDGHFRLVGRSSLAIILLLHGAFDEAEGELFEALHAARRTGDLEAQIRCLTYLTVLHRRQRRVRAAADMAERSLSLAREKEVLEYVGAAHGNLAWVALEEGDITEAETAGSEAIHCWEAQPGHAYPFHWLARLPLLAAALAQDRIHYAVAQARALIHPRQARLPERLSRALGTAVEACAAGQRERTQRALSIAVRAARRGGFL